MSRPKNRTSLLDKLPTIMGGGIFGVSCIGLIFAWSGLTFTVGIELASALGGMIFAGKFA